MNRQLVLVARPTPSGVSERALRALAAAVAARTADPVGIAYLDQADPTVHDVLDAATGPVLFVPLAVPADAYLTTWLARAVANWRETRDRELEIRIAEPLGEQALLADAVAALAAGPGKPVTASPAAFRSPAWSTIEVPARHLLVCRGPRCAVYGAGATHRALAEAVKGTDTRVTPVGCLGPCNRGPLVIDNPDGTWHAEVDEARAHAVVAGAAPAAVRAR